MCVCGWRGGVCECVYKCMYVSARVCKKEVRERERERERVCVCARACVRAIPNMSTDSEGKLGCRNSSRHTLLYGCKLI